MAYVCPRCGQPLQRGSSTTAGAVGGLVGALIYAAFGAFQCKGCGPIPRSEFPPEVRSRMTLGSLSLIGVAVALLAAVIYLLAILQRW
jgi:hypothetical protein